MKRANSLFIFFLLISASTIAQNVGIGTINPKARLHIVDSAVLFSAVGDIPPNAGNSPMTGDGRRMMWYADKAAFRAGYVPSSEWDKVNTGNYSAALGYGTIASNVGSTAFGFQTTASGVFATAMGYQTVSKALGAFTIGHNNDISDTPDPNNPLPADRIFQIGNGDFSGGHSNAVTVLRNGNVGIGTISPSQKLHIGTDGEVRIEGPSLSGGSLPSLSIGGFGDLRVDAVGIVSGRFVVKESGNVGIGNATPTVPLSFGATSGPKISLNGTNVANYGFSMGSSLLEIHSSASSTDIGFGFFSSSVFNEKFRMKGNGAFVVNGNAGSAGQILQSNGSSASPSWVTPAAYNNTNQVTPGVWTDLLTDDLWTTVGGMTYSFTTTGPAKALVLFNVEGYPGTCFSCGSSTLSVGVIVDGTLTLNAVNDVANGTFLTYPGNYLASLGAGSHTIVIQAKKYGPAMSVFGHNLIVQVIPQ